MSMQNKGLIKTFLAGATINPYRIVKFGADDDHVVQGAAASDSLIGVADRLGADAAEDRCDVVLQGVTKVELGGTVARGALVTADADGRAVAAAPAAGANNRVIGVAMVSGVVGDIGSVLIQPSSLQGA